MWKLFFVTVLANGLILSLGNRQNLGESAGGCSCHKQNSDDDEDSESKTEDEKSNRPTPKINFHRNIENSIDNESEIDNASDNESDNETENKYDNESDNDIEKSDIETDNKVDNELESYEQGEEASGSGTEDDSKNEQGDDVDCAEALGNFRDGVLRVSIRFLKSYAKSIRKETGAMSPLATLFSVGALALFSYGQTKNELYTLLNLSSREEIQCVFKTINEIAENLPDTVDFNLATNFYAHIDNRFSKVFKTVMTDIVVGVATNLNFSRPAQSMEKINKKIDSQTNNNIKTIIETRRLLNKTTELVAVSAFYFSSTWEIEFETSDKLTHFQVSRGNHVPVEFMYRQAVYNYTHCPFLNSKVVQLNLKDGIFDFLVILPDVKFSENTVIEKMDKNPVKWYNRLQQTMRPKKVEVYLPVYNQTSWVDTRELLMESTDLETIYSGDTMRLREVLEYNKDVGISVGRQKIYIELPYEGGAARKLPRKGAKVTFRANYPFIFFICLRGVVIFAGVYRSPNF